MTADSHPAATAPSEDCLSADEIGLIRELISLIVPGAERITHLALGRPLRNGSRAEAYMEEPANSPTRTGSSYIASAHLAIGVCVFAALDHLCSFAAALGEGQAMSLATLTRGAVEALGKAHYLLMASTAEEMVGRHLSLGLAELEVSVRNAGDDFRDLRGDRLDVRAHMAALKEKLAALGLDREKVRVTELASTVVSECVPGLDGLAFYSRLSAVAHGETAGVTAFLGRNIEAGIGFVQPPALVLPFTGALAKTSCTVVSGVAAHFGLEQEYQDAWHNVIAEHVGPLTNRLFGAQL